MSLSRSVLRSQAKKIYKAQIKGVPKRQRITFAKFFAQYKDMQSAKNDNTEHEHDEDFNFEDMVNINADLEVEDEAEEEV